MKDEPVLVHAECLSYSYWDCFRSPSAKQRKPFSSRVHVLLAYFRVLPLVELEKQATQLDLYFLLFSREMNPAVSKQNY